MKIVIPDYKLPSRNKLYSTSNWRLRKKLADEVHEIVSAYVPRKMIKGLVDITIYAHYKHKRRRDSDNVEAKLVIDSLKGKVLEDDDYRFVRDVTTRVIVGTKDQVEIYVSKVATTRKEKKTRTQVNKIANKKLRQLQIDKDIRHCELCSTQAITNAHRHPRVWYRGQDELLWDYNYVLFLCMKCHTKLDDRSKTTEQEKEYIFKRLRKKANI